jgi:hypothetical protein
MEAVPPVDVASRAIGVEQRFLLSHVHVWRDGHAGGELLLRAPVLVEKTEVVLLVGLHLPERGMPLFQHHLGVVTAGLAHGASGNGYQGRGRQLFVGRLFNWGVHNAGFPLPVGLPTGCNVGNLLLLRRESVPDGFGARRGHGGYGPSWRCP